MTIKRVESGIAQSAIKHVVHDYTSLMWCYWAIHQVDRFDDMARSHFAFSYFFPRRAFSDFFSGGRKYADDVLALDFSDFPCDQYARSKWEKWRTHMNTHLFHISYLRSEGKVLFDPATVVRELHAEFEENWSDFIRELRDEFRDPFPKEIDRRRPEFSQIQLFP